MILLVYIDYIDKSFLFLSCSLKTLFSLSLHALIIGMRDFLSIADRVFRIKKIEVNIMIKKIYVSQDHSIVVFDGILSRAEKAEISAEIKIRHSKVNSVFFRHIADVKQGFQLI